MVISLVELGSAGGKRVNLYFLTTKEQLSTLFVSLTDFCSNKQIPSWMMEYLSRLGGSNDDWIATGLGAAGSII